VIHAAALNRRRAFTLVELLISLSIAALLLLAMGSAFTAATNVVQASDTFFRSEQQARVALDLITTEVRRCAAVTAPGVPSTATTYTSITLTAPSTSTGQGETDFNGDSITFAYNNSSATTNPNTITMTDNTAGTETTLASNVTSASFDVVGTPSLSAVGSITLTMTVQIGTSQVTLSDSAAPRVNVSALYQ
jgi:prepilin-type N-terminal cleavage/methylation domain-containing protein